MDYYETSDYDADVTDRYSRDDEYDEYIDWDSAPELDDDNNAIEYQTSDYDADVADRYSRDDEYDEYIDWDSAPELDDDNNVIE